MEMRRDCRRANLNENTGAEGFRYFQTSTVIPRTPDSRKRPHRQRSRQSETETAGHAQSATPKSVGWRTPSRRLDA
jgi:hypothetical protein